MSDNAKTVTIIGGGFSGTVLAIQLMHQHADSGASTPLRINLVEKSPPSFAGGKAYGRAGEKESVRPELNTNTTFAQMSVFADDPDDCADFLSEARRWIATEKFASRYREITGELLPAAITDSWLRDLASRGSQDVAPRWFYGFYLRARYQDAMAALKEARPDSMVSVVYGEAQDIRSGSGKKRDVVVSRRGSKDTIIASDAVVLATGHLPAARPPFLKGDSALFERSSGYIADPLLNTAKLQAAMAGRGKKIFVAGTGLTAEDVVMMANANGFFRQAGNQLLMYSRHGLYHKPHDPKKGNNFRLDVQAFLRLLDSKVGRGDTEALKTFMADTWNRLTENFNGLAVYNGFQPHIATIRQHLIGRRGFGAAVIDRMIDEAKTALTAALAPNARQNAEAMQQLMQSGKVTRGAAEILSVKPVTRSGNPKFEVTFRENGSSEVSTTIVDVFVDATGNTESLSSLKKNGALPPLYRNLLSRGLISPFVTGGGAVERGLAVGPDRHALGSNGRPVDWLYAVGAPTAGVAAHQDNRLGGHAANIVTIRNALAGVATTILEQLGLHGRPAIRRVAMADNAAWVRPAGASGLQPHL